MKFKLTTEYFAFVGDWNCPPDQEGRYSPRWLAKQTRAHVYAAKAGKHGRIDHVITNARVRGHERIPGGYSDHDLIIAEIVHPEDPRRRLKVAYWNVQRDRDKNRRVVMFEFLGRVIERHKVDVVALQETSDYHTELQRFFVDMGWVWVGSATPTHRHNCIAVRGGLKVRDKQNHQLSKQGWLITQLDPPRMRAPLGAPSVAVDGWLSVLSHHGVVRVDPTPHGLEGGAHRVKVWRQSMRRLSKLGRSCA